MRTIEADHYISSSASPWVWHRYDTAGPATKTCPLWAALSDVMREAYKAGDTSTLESVKALQPQGFANIDDLGEPFSKYGSDPEGWDQMIVDAKSSATQQTAE